MTLNSTIDKREIEKFTNMANEWWNEGGKFKPLHQLNPVRIEFIRDAIEKHFGRLDISAIDIGCGGGLVSEPLARIGVNITGIDAGEKNINIATHHAKKSNLNIEYICTNSSEITKKYDVVLALEIIEHVADVEIFLADCRRIVADNGLLIISTLNRTIKSLFMAKIGAEYIMRWLPRSTHNYNKFLRPSEIEQQLRNMELKDISGIVYNLFNQNWRMDKNDIDVNYIMVFGKS